MKYPIFAALLVIFAAQVHAQGDAEAGKITAYTCTGCHGIPGYINAYPTYHVPKIGGQNEQYVITALKAYKSGERKHSTMQAQAMSFDDQQIANSAAYFASLEGEPQSESNTKGNVARGETKSVPCQACHGQDGNGVDPMYPRLAGQYEDYLVKSLQGYRSGERDNAIMKGFAATLTDQDIQDLAAFYASKEGLFDLKIH